MGGVRRDGRVQRALARGRQAVVDRIMRWRGHPPELAGVREPRRPRPTLPADAIALPEPRAGRRRLRRTTFRWTKYGTAFADESQLFKH